MNPTRKQPTPSKKPADALHERGPRERALDHMKKLLTTTAVAGAALQATACPVQVCDPLPPPVTCEPPETSSHLLQNHMHAMAQWKWDGTAFLIAVSVDSYADNLTIVGDPVLSNATLSGTVTRTTSDLTFDCLPSGTALIEVDVPLTCFNSVQTLRFTIDPTESTPQDGVLLFVTPLD